MPAMLTRKMRVAPTAATDAAAYFASVEELAMLTSRT